MSFAFRPKFGHLQVHVTKHIEKETVQLIVTVPRMFTLKYEVISKTVKHVSKIYFNYVQIAFDFGPSLIITCRYMER